jgi:hypothetical protein
MNILNALSDLMLESISQLLLIPVLIHKLTCSIIMKKTISIFLSLVILVSCNNSEAPDVSDLKVDVIVQRFDRDFFAIDTNRILPSLQQLYSKYPSFLGDYFQNILGLPPVNDTSTATMAAIRQFLSDYKPVKDSAEKLFKNIDNVEETIVENLKYVKHYFPKYQLPRKLITFIGPMDAYFEGSLGGYGDVITNNALAIGLQLHLGKDFSLYKSEMGQALYPAYISRRFTPEYIPVNCTKNIIDDIFPDQSGGKHLIIQMVEKGKRMYLLDKLMPHTADTLKTGYTQSQLQGCYNNEGLIWNYFLTNGLLYNNDPGMIKNYIGESPNTPEFGEGAPGNIGLFTGWQIVKKYMDKNPTVSLGILMQTDSKKIFEESKYRPK